MLSGQSGGHRRSIRLPGYDYSQSGAYFVTICTQNGECLFDDPVLRRVAETLWQQIPSHSSQVSLDASVVMPNHTHGILLLNGGAHNPPRNASPLSTSVPSGCLGAIVGTYKSVTTRRINQIRKTPGVTVWQRNYYEHIIRTERALGAIREYISNNPTRWYLDKCNTQASGPDPMAAELWRLLKEETL